MLLYKFEELYQQIRENALNGACTVLILVAADVDGLCASRSLTHLLRSDNITYSLLPVSGYTHTHTILRSLGESNNDIRSIILVNCGAIVNLTNLLPWDRPELTCYVVDSHRPIHLANVYERERVFVLHDEEEEMQEKDFPSDGEGLSGGESSSDEDDDEEEEEEEIDTDGGEEWDGDEEERRRRRREEDGDFSELEDEDEADFGDTPKKKKKDKKKKKKKKSARDSFGLSSGEESEMEEDEEEEEEEEEEEGGSESEAEEADDEEEENDDDEDGSAASRRKSKKKSKKSKSKHRRRRRSSSLDLDDDDEEDENEEEEDTPTKHTSPSHQHQETARQRRQRERTARRARRRRIEQYYLGAYHGAPSALVLHRICQEVNRETRDTLWLAIVGLTDLLVHQRVEGEQYRQMVGGLEIEVQASQAQELSGFEAEDGTLVPAVDSGRIVADFEYQFMLYRHWSLYDSMYHSPYIASKLLVWWSHGKQRLEELLAKMGFSLAQCRENFKYMDADLKAQLREELDAHHDEFGLEEVFYLSFHRRTHYGAAVSASDVVYSVAALLEAWQGPAGSATDPTLTATGTPEEQAAAAERLFTARFHEAYDALSGQDEGKLAEGIHLAMALQKAIFRVAVSLHDKKAIRNLDHFRWTVIHNNLASAEDYLLTQPMAISRLAQLMIDVSREEKLRQQAATQRQNLWKPKPFLVFAERRNTYLVVGVPCPDQRGEVVKHKFASLFRLAAEGCKARYRHDGFDSAVLELDKDSATRFTESLFLACDAGKVSSSGGGRRGRGKGRGGRAN